MPSTPGKGAGLTVGKEGVWGFAATAREGHIFSHDQRVMYVDRNYPTATDLGNTGEDPLCPFATVAAALARCRDDHGDTIFVAQNGGWKYGAGVYFGGTSLPVREEVEITVSGVHLIGAAPGYGVAWEPVTPGGAGTCITISAMDVHIEGFAFQGAAAGGRGIYAEWDGATLYGENFVVRNCSFDEDIDVGIQLENNWNSEIGGCVFQNCAVYGIYLDPAVPAASDLYVHDCRFLDCTGGAISMRGLDNSVIKDCTFYNGVAQGGGLATDLGIDLAGGDDNMVVDNYFSCVLPVLANGDWDDFCSGGGTDAWIGNQLINGLAVTTPA